MPSDRRSFLKRIGATAAAAQVTTAAPQSAAPPANSSAAGLSAPGPVAFPRTFTGRQLAQIAFPLGGVAAGSISLGGRGQLRDWEIFNRPDQGRGLSYAFPSLFVDDGRQKIARVLEARLLPPFTGQDGLGARNAPGLTRLASARFTGEYPLARIEFEDPSLPVHIALEAFSPFIPHEEDESGLPVAILRYRVKNGGAHPASVSIAWSIENPVLPEQNAGRFDATRSNQFRTEGPLTGLFMSNPALAADDPLHGSFVLALLAAADGEVTHLAGWPKGKWWDAPLLFWDDFSADGRPRPGSRRAKCRSAPCAWDGRSPPVPSANTPSCWPGIFPIARPRAADGARPRATRTPSSAIGTPRASPTPGPRPTTPRKICPRSSARPASSPPPCATVPSRPP